MPKLPKLSGPEYNYLGRFKNEKFIRQGHNLSGTMELVKNTELPNAKNERLDIEEKEAEARLAAAQKKDEKGKNDDDDSKKKLLAKGAMTYLTGGAGAAL